MRHLASVSCRLAGAPVLASALALTVLLAACGDAAAVRPKAPAQNDPAFTVAGAPTYLLVGDELTPGTASFTLSVAAPAGVDAIDLWLDGDDAVALDRNGATFTTTVNATRLAAGLHGLMLSERGADEAFYRLDFSKGHALYVMISTDWDFSDVDDRVLAHHEDLHMKHPELKITHLIGPYVFTDPATSPARREAIVTWAKMMRDTYGDEIGLHVHPYCNFVTTTGVTCRTTPSTTKPAGDDTGYTIRLDAYTRDEWNTMFAKADEIWAANGWGKPTSFRAGGWTLGLSTAQALADSGYLADSSANNWGLMEEWMGYDLYTWNKMQWSSIGATSQPYYPTEDSILPGGTGAQIPLLEVPDNGIMVDYWTVEEMRDVFHANWNGGPLAEPTQVSTGFHPAPTAYYSPDEFERLDAFFTLADEYLASELAGPVVYINMSDAAKVW